MSGVGVATERRTETRAVAKKAVVKKVAARATKASAKLEQGVLAEADVVRIGAQIEEEVTAAVEFADASPSPEPDQLFAHAYATAVLNAPHQLPCERLVTIP
jgi:TPP-dependent pyruvate/acetoin dehydrogenase alpha subunit